MFKARSLIWKVAALLAITIAVFSAVGYHNARATPIVRRVTIGLPRWPTGAAPIRVALISDIHMESAAMDAGRLQRIVAQVNRLHPDLIVLGGDFIEARGEAEAVKAVPLLEPALRALKAPLGVVAVLGNHDHWTDPVMVQAMLRRDGITILDNDAIVAGPLALGGVDDPSTEHARLKPTLKAMRRLPGARVLIAHSPDIAPHLGHDGALLLAGHTHCGQVVLPIIGPPIDVADPRYRCGLVRDPGRIVIVTAGVGTSNLPIRFGAPPDLWLITLGPLTKQAEPGKD